MSVAKTSSHEKFQPLTDGQLDSLYAAIGNHEGKAIVLGGMDTGQGYRSIELHRDLFVAPQGENPVFVGTNNPREWTQNSFVPHGLVEERQNTHKEYYLTDFGFNEGQSLAGWQLDLSLNSSEALSLRGLMGMSKTRAEKGTRPPVDRLNIFAVLLEESSISMNGLAKKISLSSTTLLNNIESLTKQGIIDYDSLGSSKLPEAISYEILDGHISGVNGGGMREAVHGTLIEMQKNGQKQFSIADFFESTERLYEARDFTKVSQRKHAYQIIRNLVDSGNLIKKNKPSYKSEISLMPFMRKAVGQLVSIAEGMKENSADFNREGAIKLQEILDDQEKVKALVSKAFSNSPEANGIDFDTRSQHILSFLSDNPGANLSQIASGLEDLGLTKNSARETLGSLRKKGKIDSKKNKGVNIWHIAD